MIPGAVHSGMVTRKNSADAELIRYSSEFLQIQLRFCSQLQSRIVKTVPSVIRNISAQIFLPRIRILPEFSVFLTGFRRKAATILLAAVAVPVRADSKSTDGVDELLSRHRLAGRTGAAS